MEAILIPVAKPLRRIVHWCCLCAVAFCSIGLMGHSLLAQERWGQENARSRSGVLDTGFQGSDWVGAAGSSRQWNLGVQGDSSDVGVLIRQVTPGGAASRARIQPGDSVVAVEGFQVGFIGGRLYDLSDEINHRADAKGAARLLLQDGQTGRLASVRIQLDRQTQQLSGTLRSPQPLPADAEVTVQIENLTRPKWIVRNGRRVFSAANQRNIPFEIAYDPLYISADDIYQVRAFVSSRGRNIMFSPQPVRVLTQGNPSQVELRLEEVVSSGSSAPASGQASSNGMLTGFANYNQLDDEVIRIYRLYLGRAPSPAELAAARILGDDLKTLTDRLPLKLMASAEYFDLARNDNDFWLSNVFGVIVGRQPSPAEITRWKQRFSELRHSRTELLKQLHRQAR